MTWFICAAGVVFLSRVVVTASLEADGFGLLVGDINWLPWVVNLD